MALPPTSTTDAAALAQALGVLTETTSRMEEAYRLLENRIAELDQELAEKNRQLETTSDYLRSVLESMSDGVIAVDNEGRITSFNRAAASLLGFDANDVHGQLFDTLLGRPFLGQAADETSHLSTRDGRTITVSERDSPLADASGRQIGMVKTFQDLSEVVALRAAIQQKERLAALGEMAASVAHEIRNPLGGIRGFAHFLQSDTPKSDPRRRLVEKILAGTQRLDRVVSELLDFTRPIELDLRPVACATLVDEALRFVECDAERICIETDIPGDLVVYVDPNKLQQVLLNLLTNAIQSIDDRGAIRVAARREHDRVAIEIRDTGCGMSPDQHDRAFSPFFTTKEQGTGLGLAICRNIAEAHRARLDAASQPGVGSVFTLTFPERN